MVLITVFLVPQVTENALVHSLITLFLHSFPSGLLRYLAYETQ